MFDPSTAPKRFNAEGKRICSVGDCPELHLAKGRCRGCYNKAKYRGLVGDLIECSDCGNLKPHGGHGRCHRCYNKAKHLGLLGDQIECSDCGNLKPHGGHGRCKGCYGKAISLGLIGDRLCSVVCVGEPCGRPHRAQGLCHSHHWRLLRYGDPLEEIPLGALPDHSKGTALYKIRDAEFRLVYVGISFDPRKRFQRHSHESAWWPGACYATIELHPTRAAAVEAERQAIRNECPVHNVQGQTSEPAFRPDNLPEEAVAFHRGETICFYDPADLSGPWIQEWLGLRSVDDLVNAAITI